MAATTKWQQPTTSKSSAVKKSSARKKPFKFLAVKNKPAKKAPIKKSPTTRAMAKKARAKKIVDSTPTVEQQLKSKTESYDRLVLMYSEMTHSYIELKNSFAMLKENHEREKNRLDKAIDIALNNSKSLEVMTSADSDSLDSEGINWDFEKKPL